MFYEQATQQQQQRYTATPTAEPTHTSYQAQLLWTFPHNNNDRTSEVLVFPVPFVRYHLITGIVMRLDHFRNNSLGFNFRKNFNN